VNTSRLRQIGILCAEPGKAVASPTGLVLAVIIFEWLATEGSAVELEPRGKAAS